MGKPQANYRFFEGGGWPAVYEANGLSATFNTDFRVWLKYAALQNDKHLTTSERNILSLKLCYQYPDKVLSDIQQLALPTTLAMDGISWFYSCGDTDRLKHIKITPRMEEALNKEEPAEFNYYWDFMHIWAAVKLSYNIDLYKITDLHWWGFTALFLNLPATNSLGSLRRLRNMTEAEFMGKDKGPSKADWGTTVLKKRLHAIPEFE